MIWPVNKASLFLQHALWTPIPHRHDTELYFALHQSIKPVIPPLSWTGVTAKYIAAKHVIVEWVGGKASKPSQPVFRDGLCMC